MVVGGGEATVACSGTGNVTLISAELVGRCGVGGTLISVAVVVGGGVGSTLIYLARDMRVGVVGS